MTLKKETRKQDKQREKEEFSEVSKLSLHSDQIQNEEEHPLTKRLQSVSWNNIPLPVKELFEVVTFHVILNEKDSASRKAIWNERMFKLQHMISLLHARVKEYEDKTLSKQSDVIKQIRDSANAVDLKL